MDRTLGWSHRPGQRVRLNLHTDRDPIGDQAYQRCEWKSPCSGGEPVMTGFVNKVIWRGQGSVTELHPSESPRQDEVPHLHHAGPDPMMMEHVDHN